MKAATASLHSITRFRRKEMKAIFADLFFYEGCSRYGETYATDGKGGIWMVGQQGISTEQ